MGKVERRARRVAGIPPPAALSRWLATGFPGGGPSVFVGFFLCWFPPPSWYLKCGLWQVERCIAERRSWLKVDGWFFILNGSWLWMQHWEVLQVKGFSVSSQRREQRVNLPCLAWAGGGCRISYVVYFIQRTVKNLRCAACSASFIL